MSTPTLSRAPSVAPPQRPSEEQVLHTRLLKCALEVEDARAFWAHMLPGQRVSPQQAFQEYWFGARSLPASKCC